ncbi:MAG: hypothetical protein KatS3mg027_1034 [Bacteroidia bacterium]|nr:MAG: hypothetical protein KatS3mg027_1034 [Bacteroidia bacterium]
MKLKFLLVTSSVILALLNFSCSGDKTEEEITNVVDSSQTNSNQDELTSNYETFFQVPSPGEMLSFIKSVGKRDKSKLNILNAVENINKYTDNKSKALNFGIYSTDLSYCSIFNMGAESIKYFKVVKQLGDQLGLSSTIKPEILARIEKNIDNTDSLSIITDDLYYSSFETLDESKQGHTLALVVAGGWLESVYIAINMVDKFQSNSPVVQRIADQKYTLENLIEFLKKHEGDSEDVKQVKSDMENLMQVFNLLKEEKLSDTKIEQSGDKKLIGGGINLVIDEKLFNEIKTKVTNLRQAYTQNK